MNLNEISTGIELLGTNVNNLVVNNTLANYSDAKERKIDFYINEPDFGENETGPEGRIEIGFDIDIICNEKQTLHLEISLEGGFVPVGDVDEEQFKRLVLINGAAALVGIARGKIEAISSSVLNCGKIVIPFINVVDYYKEVSKNNKG